MLDGRRGSYPSSVNAEQLKKLGAMIRKEFDIAVKREQQLISQLQQEGSTKLRDSVRRFAHVEKVKITEHIKARIELDKAEREAKIQSIMNRLPNIREQARKDALGKELQKEGAEAKKLKLDIEKAEKERIKRAEDQLKSAKEKLNKINSKDGSTVSKETVIKSLISDKKPEVKVVSKPEVKVVKDEDTGKVTTKVVKKPAVKVVKAGTGGKAKTVVVKKPASGEAVKQEQKEKKAEEKIKEKKEEIKK